MRGVEGRERGRWLDLAQLTGEHQAFHQRVAGQAIGAMHAGARHFTHGIEAGNRGGGHGVGVHASHPVVGGRRHGNGRARGL